MAKYNQRTEERVLRMSSGGLEMAPVINTSGTMKVPKASGHALAQKHLWAVPVSSLGMGEANELPSLWKKLQLRKDR